MLDANMPPVYSVDVATLPHNKGTAQKMERRKFNISYEHDSGKGVWSVLAFDESGAIEKAKKQVLRCGKEKNPRSFQIVSRSTAIRIAAKTIVYDSEFWFQDVWTEPAR